MFCLLFWQENIDLLKRELTIPKYGVYFICKLSLHLTILFPLFLPSWFCGFLISSKALWRLLIFILLQYCFCHVNDHGKGGLFWEIKIWSLAILSLIPFSKFGSFGNTPINILWDGFYHSVQWWVSSFVQVFKDQGASVYDDLFIKWTFSAQLPWWHHSVAKYCTYTT